MKTILLSMTLVLGMSQAKAFDKVADGLSSIIAYPAVYSIVSTCAMLNTPCFGRKEIVAVKGDAQDYLAGEEATESLVKAVELLRANVPELSQASNEEIVQMIATLE